MTDPEDNAPPPGRRGARPLIYGPFPRHSLFEDHGDTIEERSPEVNHVARAGARGDVIDHAVVPAIRLAILLNAGLERIAVETVQTDSDDSIAAEEATIEETGEHPRICNVFTRCCATETSSMDGAEAQTETENPSVRSVNGELLTGLQSVDISSLDEGNDDPNITDTQVNTFDSIATASEVEITPQEDVETRDSTPEEVVQSLLNEILDRVVPVEPEEVVKPLVFELVERAVPLEQEIAVDIPSHVVLGAKEKREKASRIRQMIDTVLCRNRRSEVMPSLPAGSEEYGEMAEIPRIVTSRVEDDVHVQTVNSEDNISKSGSSLENADGEQRRRKGPKSKVIRFFKRRNKNKNKGPAVKDITVNHEDVDIGSIKDQNSNEAVNEIEASYPRVSAGQTQLSCHEADVTEAHDIHASPKKTKRDIMRRMFHYCICIGSAHNEVDADDEFEDTTVSAESHE